MTIRPVFFKSRDIREGGAIKDQCYFFICLKKKKSILPVPSTSTFLPERSTSNELTPVYIHGQSNYYFFFKKKKKKTFGEI